MNFLLLAANVVLSWAPVTGADHYDLYVSTTSLKGGVEDAAQAYRTAEATYTVPGLVSGTTYYFHVKVYCPFGTVLGSSNELVYVAK